MKALFMLVGCCIAVAAGAVLAQERVGEFTPSTERLEGGETRHSISASPLGASRSPTMGASLTWLCAAQRLRIAYAPGGALDGDALGGIDARFRADGDDAVTEQQWWVSSDGQRAVVPIEDTDAVTAIAKSEGVIVIDIDDTEGGRSYNHRFRLTGFNAALGHLPCA